MNRIAALDDGAEISAQIRSLPSAGSRSDGKNFTLYMITKVKNNQNPMKGGNPIAPAGNILNDAAADELDKVALNGESKNGGMKVSGANQVNGPTVNGTARTGTPGTSIREQSGIDGDEQTWAHELGQSLGLGHDASSNNLMFPSRRKPSPPSPANTPAGNSSPSSRRPSNTVSYSTGTTILRPATSRAPTSCYR